MKRYSVSRILLFTLLAEFEMTLAHAGELFVDAFMTEQTAQAILAKYPQAVSPL